MIDLEMEIKELGRSTQQYSQHNIADPLSQVCHSRLAVGRSQQVKEYKHTHANNSNPPVVTGICYPEEILSTRPSKYQT